MTRENIKKLDRLFQELVLQRNSNMSILGGEATLVHHFITKNQGLSTRWYIPNGIPLRIDQHNIIHSKDGKLLETEIVNIKGNKWMKDLNTQRMKFGKYATFQDVFNYLNGLTDNYV